MEVEVTSWCSLMLNVAGLNYGGDSEREIV